MRRTILLLLVFAAACADGPIFPVCVYGVTVYVEAADVSDWLDAGGLIGRCDEIPPDWPDPPSPTDGGAPPVPPPVAP